jgi:hypothetical protein
MGNWTPSIVPAGEDQSVYLVVDDFGDLGRCWRETDVEATDLETVITDMLDGQYNSPVRVIGFNTAEGSSRDVSADVAEELRRRCDLQLRVQLRKNNLARLSARRADGIHLAPFEQGEIGPDLFNAACDMMLEGLVSKRRDSRYRAGPSRDWIKVKNPKSPAMDRAKDMF